MSKHARMATLENVAAKFYSRNLAVHSLSAITKFWAYIRNMSAW